MKAAVVTGPGLPPVYGDFADPDAAAGETIVNVSAAAISPLARSRASGQHYSSKGTFPFVAGVDGVGRLEDGRRVYFVLPRAPFGSMARRAPVAATGCIPVPDALDDATAAAIVNPGMSSWAALTDRAQLKTGETVLINGATGVAGRLAVQIARHLGAGRVIATGRNQETLGEVAALGADVTIPLVEDQDELEEIFKPHFAQGVDVVVDYLWGRSAERLLIAAAKAADDDAAVRYVEVGSASGAEITLPAAVLRAAPIALMGSGLGSVSPARFLEIIRALLDAAVPARLRIATRSLPLDRVDQAWRATDGARMVVTMDVA